MPTYASPGVYVEEIPSAVQAIAGVSTSTASFIGIFPASVNVPEPNPKYDPTKKSTPAMTSGVAAKTAGGATAAPSLTVADRQETAAVDHSDDENAKRDPVIEVADDLRLTVDASPEATTDATKKSTPAAAAKTAGDAKAAPSLTVADRQETAALDHSDDENAKRDPVLSPEATTDATNSPFINEPFTTDVPAGEPRLVTNFSEFRRLFGGFSTNPDHNRFVHSIFAFFNNGGSRCYIVRLADSAGMVGALDRLEAIEEISIVAAPGVTDPDLQGEITARCELRKTWFAILDAPEVVDLTQAPKWPDNSKFAAVYFPWIQTFDPSLKIQKPDDTGLAFVPPSGFMAGIYARVDNQRGVHKAAANEVVLGAVGLRYLLRKAQQDDLNPRGVNCIRYLNGAYRVWGARTIGGDSNGEWKYVPVRRTMIYLRKSIDEGTQWVVFEPNDLALWNKIVRNVSAFLSIMRRNGALFGATDAEAFYVKCDRETNPPELRDQGQVVTEIGVAIVRPAEFIIFRVSQWTATATQ